MLLEISGEITSERMKRRSPSKKTKTKKHPVVDVTDVGSKLCYSKEQYCIGTWNNRFINQSKLKVVKQEMARMNIDILGISKLKLT